MMRKFVNFMTVVKSKNRELLSPSSRHHVSCDDCLQNKREKVAELFCAVFCLTVVHSIKVKAKGKGFPMLDTERWARS